MVSAKAVPAWWVGRMAGIMEDMDAVDGDMENAMCGVADTAQSADHPGHGGHDVQQTHNGCRNARRRRAGGGGGQTRRSRVRAAA